MLGPAANRQPGFRRKTRRAEQRREKQTLLTAGWLWCCLAGWLLVLLLLAGWLAAGWVAGWLAGLLTAAVGWLWCCFWLAASLSAAALAAWLAAARWPLLAA